MTQLRVREVGGHRFGTLPAPILPGLEGDRLTRALAEIQALPAEAFDLLSNPFESKLVLRDKFGLPAYLESVMREMERLAALAEVAFGVDDLRPDGGRHYAGVFRYRPGDHLAAHVDAGIHPVTKERKHVTALLYLGESEGGFLELWNGTSCAESEPRLETLAASLPPDHGRLVFFENNDTAWHAAGMNTGQTDRIVVTVSFMSDEIERFANRRERAYFVPRPWEVWTPDVVALRDRRADPERYAEVYRAGAGGMGS